jgi:hypothetical protein
VQPGDVGASRGAAANVESLVSARKGPVQRATEADLKKLPKDLAGSAVAAAAVAMAREIDAPDNSATSKSMCAARLVDAMDQLHGEVKERPEPTKLDEIAKRREQRLARRSGA